MGNLTPEARQKLDQAQNIWVATTRPDGRPHLTPVCFVFVKDRVYISIDPESVKSKNIDQNRNVVLALEDGLHPVICEGEAVKLTPPWDNQVLSAFHAKYEWDIRDEKQYKQVVEIIPARWLLW